MPRSEPRRSSPLVLIVDDTALVRRMGREALEPHGLEVVEAVDGHEALRRFEEHNPNLVLLDVHMPGLDGFQVCEAIRRHERGADTPIVVMTATDDVESVRRAYEVGATDFVTKPIQWMIVRERARYMLRMTAAVVELRRSRQSLAEAQRIARLGSFELALESGRISGSPEFLRLYEFEAEEDLSLDRLLRLVHPDDRSLTRSALERAVAQGESLRVDHRLLLRNGEERTLHLQASPIAEGEAERILRGTVQDITERKRAEDQIRFLAYHDSLTRLGNRRLFTERLAYTLCQARRFKTLVAVLFLDLDHFKRINDTLGHSAGDAFLVNVADRLRHSVRDSDWVSRDVHGEGGPTVSRFGGDEFLVALCGIHTPTEAGQVAERILQALAAPFQLEGESVVIGASIGIAIAPQHGEDVETLIQNADVAMYHAKQTGRGRYQLYQPSMTQEIASDLRMEGDLRHALERGELFLHYQPKVEVRGGRLTGFEALVRWKHPVLGMIPPSEFVALAERAGLICALGEHVLRSACGQLRRWKELGLPPTRVSVNISAHQFAGEAIPSVVDRIARETGLDPRELDLEITESSMMENPEATAEALEAVRGIGITVSLDDFGTGYSSLGYLKRFPIDTVKIDRSFVRNLESDPEDAALTAAIISMAKALGLRVVAEGVETADQLRFLREHGCEEAQGYLFTPPLPAEEATALLRGQVPIAAFKDPE